MNISIRRASESDIDIVQEFGSKLLNFERENYDPSLDKNWALSEEAKQKYLAAINDQYVLIAEVSGQPVGFLIASVSAPKAGNARPIKQAYLQNIFVEEKMRSTGVGGKLLEELKAYCKSEAVTRLGVSVLAANKTAVDFYKKTGFTERSINLAMEFSS